MRLIKLIYAWFTKDHAVLSANAIAKFDSVRNSLVKLSESALKAEQFARDEAEKHLATASAKMALRLKNAKVITNIATLLGEEPLA